MLLTLEPEEQGAERQRACRCRVRDAKGGQAAHGTRVVGLATADARLPLQPWPRAATPLAGGARRAATGPRVGRRSARVHGSGTRGRITPEDVQAAAGAAAGASGATAGLPSSAAAAAREPVVPPGEPGQRRLGTDPPRAISARSAGRSPRRWSVRPSTIPHVTNFDDADVTELEQLRKGVPPGLPRPGRQADDDAAGDEGRGAGAATTPDRSTPASTTRTSEIVYKQYVNLGVAVDTPRGLVVPAVRGVDRMSIARDCRGAGQAGRARPAPASFAIEDLRGGTFTISNLGAVGGTY